MGADPLIKHWVDRDWTIAYFRKLLKDAEEEGPEHNAFYFLEDGIEKYLKLLHGADN